MNVFKNLFTALRIWIQPILPDADIVVETVELVKLVPTWRILLSKVLKCLQGFEYRLNSDPK